MVKSTEFQKRKEIVCGGPPAVVGGDPSLDFGKAKIS